MKYTNTLQKGSVRYIVFLEKETWYAVGLEFNIVESGETPQEALILLFDAVQGYVESAQKMKARPGILNQKADAEYESLWNALIEKRASQKHQIFTFGQCNPFRKRRDLIATSYAPRIL